MDYKAEALASAGKAKEYLTSTDGWEKVSKSTNDVLLESKASDYFSGKMFRMTFKVNASLDDTFANYVAEPGSPRLQWDKNIENMEILKEIDSKTRIVWWSSGSVAMGLISPRDRVTVSLIDKQDHQATITSSSIEYPDCPPKKDYVRAHVYPSGYIIVADPSSSNSCTVTMVLHADLKGNIPRSVFDSALPTALVNSASSFLDFLKKNGILAK